MVKTEYKIQVITDFYDENLRTAWLKLENKTDAFPQVFYEWIEPWWRYNARRRKLYIVTAVNFDGTIIGIAPLCIENRYGFKVLSSIPIHFNDRYDFIVSGDVVQDHVFECLLEYIKSFQEWNFVKISKVRSNTDTYSFTNRMAFKSKCLGNILLSNLESKSYEGFLKQLKRNDRVEYNRRLRRLKELGEIDFLILNKSEDYLKYEKDFRRIYELRWSKLERLPSEDYYAYRRLAYVNCCEKDKALFCVLKLNDEVIAYRLGFVHKKTYFDYKLSFNPEYGKYGLGAIVTGLLVEKLIEVGIDFLDHGAGDYVHKRPWASLNNTQRNFDFFLSDGKVLSQIVLRFELQYKDRLRKYYNKIKALIQ